MYPILNVSAESRQVQDVFAGYNHNQRINDAEFYDMRNLTSDAAPVLSPRKPRGLFSDTANTQGMIAKDSLCYVDGQYFVMNEYRVDMMLSIKPEDFPKQLVSMGAYVIILPDKKYINTANITDWGSIEADVQSIGDVTFSLAKKDGTALTPDYVAGDEPQNPHNMALWLDISSTPHSLKQWSESEGMWAGVASTYVRIQSVGIGKAFSVYDGVQITIPEDTTDQLNAMNGAAILYGCGDDFILIPGIIDGEITISSPVSVARKMPYMDFVVESNNRLWGCRYGLNASGEFVNEVYACKLGDFKNWNCFMGISTDSYAVSLGSDGVFTGAISHAGYPLFFKETCMHKIYGQIPANFQIQTTACRGVQEGCSQSLAIVNEVLYYKARHAVCAYDGSLPQEVSAELGENQYDSAVAASHGNKYYISMRETVSGVWALFVYDTAKRIWHKEDDLQALQMCSCRNELYCCLPDRKIITMLGSGDAYEQDVEWMAQTGIINVSLPDRQYLKRISVRMVLEPGSCAAIYAQYDSMGFWEKLCYMKGTNLRSFTMPVRPRRCDHLRIRIEGKGKCMIFAITKTLSAGSDMT